MRTFERLLVCFLCFVPSLAAQSQPVDSTQISRILQDATGQVWGSSAARGSSLYRWEGDAWKYVALDAASGTSATVSMATGPDGAVYCLWGRGEGEHSVTWHKGTVSKTLAHFAADAGDQPNIFVDPRKNIWITGRGVHIYRLTPEGKAEDVYTIEYDRRYAPNLPSGAHMNFEPVSATADEQGRVWFWPGGPQGGGVPSLDGILIFDGKKFELHTEFPGLAIKRYSVVAPDDPDHMWVASDHLYRVDTRTFITEVVPEPAPNAFRSVQRIFRAGGATYVVTANGSVPVAERGGEGRLGVLWRQQGGEWKRVVNGIDMRPSFFTDPLRSLAATPAGIWLGAYGTGPWFIPTGNGEPVHIDWRYGFSLEGSEALTALPDGRLLVVAVNTKTMAFKPSELLASFQTPANVQTLNPLRVFVADKRNHLWGFISGDSKGISEWDGKTWKEHSLPDEFEPQRFWNFGIDSRDRIWILHSACQGKVSILNSAGENPESYPDFSAALQAQLPDRGSFQIRGDGLTVPTFTGDGRIGYRDGCGQAHYFDGREWLMWRAQEIDLSRRGSFDGPAFFDAAGNFAVNIAGRTWEYTPTLGWRATSYEIGLGSDQQRRAPNSTPPPPGCDVANPDSVAEDRLGTYWLTSRGQLYRAVPGQCVPQFSPGQRQPFGDARTIKAALIDPEGNTFLETYLRSHPNIGEYVIVKAQSPLPQTQLRATVEASGFVKLQFATPVKGKVWFTWRIDGGDWSSPTETAETTLSWLANGKHTIEAAALDERLQIDPNPPRSEVTIQVDPQAQIAALIEQLKDPSYDKRDAAVAGLVRQPALALPALQSTREKADADQRWWIDAAIQQIKDGLPKAKEP
jgi:streptogramin lyase